MIESNDSAVTTEFRWLTLLENIAKAQGTAAFVFDGVMDGVFKTNAAVP